VIAAVSSRCGVWNERTKMQRPNQSASTECCLGEGEDGASLEGALGRTTSEKRTQGTWRAASGSHTSLKQSSAETQKNADGEKV
jgi:hypothetical protein